MSQTFYRTHKGRVCAAWWATDWLRRWLSEADLWALLEGLSPARLERFGRIVHQKAAP